MHCSRAKSFMWPILERSKCDLKYRNWARLDPEHPTFRSSSWTSIAISGQMRWRCSPPPCRLRWKNSICGRGLKQVPNVSWGLSQANTCLLRSIQEYTRPAQGFLKPQAPSPEPAFSPSQTALGRVCGGGLPPNCNRAKQQRRTDT